MSDDTWATVDGVRVCEHEEPANECSECSYKSGKDHTDHDLFVAGCEKCAVEMFGSVAELSS